MKQILQRVFGQFNYSAPPWVAPAGKWIGRHKVTMLVAAAIVIGGAVAYPHVKKRMPYFLPDQVAVANSSVRVMAPGRTDYENEGKPQALALEFTQPAAPLARIGREAQEVSLDPAHPGKWTWATDTRLEFTPAREWPVGQDFTIKLGKKAIAAHVKAEREYTFRTAGFGVAFKSAEFYQDPTQVNLRKGVYELHFSHPVNPGDFEKSLALALDGKPVKYTLTYDKWRTNATVQSEPLAIPAEPATLVLQVDSGLKAKAGGDGLKDALTRAVVVPGLYGLEVASVETRIVTSPEGELEHVLSLATGMAVNEKEMARVLSVWQLPPAAKDKAWDDPAEVTPAVLKSAQKVALKMLPQEREASESHTFQFAGEAGRQIFVRVAKGMKTPGGYQLARDYDAILQVKAFAPELSIMSSGALLALNGERKLPLMVRDLPGVKVEIGRLLPHQLHMLATHADGTFSKPEFYRGITPDSLTERFEKKVALAHKPGKTQFETIDFSEYLKGDGGERRGVFLVSVRGFDPKAKDNGDDEERRDRNPDEYYEGEGGGEGEGDGEGAAEPKVDPSTMSDRRLVLLTDLGVITKRSTDNSQRVYVQSISTGQAVAGASIEVWGRNGLVLQTQVTDANGAAQLPDLSAYKREKAPVLLVVKKAGDLSFMALNRHDRQLDLSRFDVGGIHSGGVPNQMNAYLFSDRGIYRPGDTIRVGVIVKSGDWAQDLKDLVLEASVTDARGQLVKREKLKLGPSGMAEFAHTTQDASPTGAYGIELSLPREEGGGAPLVLGSTSVKVQEFLPERTKVAVRLSSPVSEGWVHPADLKATLHAENLFGTPAPNRKVEAVVTLTPSAPAFRAWPEHRFSDPRIGKERFSDTIADQATDDKGNAEFDLGLHRYKEATYRLHVLARAFEPEGGRSVSGEVQAVVSDLPFLVGVKTGDSLDYVAKGSERRVNLVAIDPQARRMGVPGLKLERIESKFVSVLVKQANGLFKYESKSKESVLKTEALSLPAAGMDLKLDTSTPGNFAYVVRTAEGLALNRVDYSVAGAGNVTRSLDRNAELQLTLNKKEFVPGEEIEISVRAPYAGAGLITIERDKVYASKWFKADKSASVQKITLPKDYDGNGYVMVQFTRDPSSDEIYMSPLSYGVAPFATSLARRTTRIALTAPKLAKPGQIVQFKLDAPKPVRAVVFAVDEGILQVARYKDPDPLQHFFQKRALEVTTAQTLDQILPEFRKLMQGAAPGGDGDGTAGKHLNPFKRKRDKPVVFWSGIVDVNGSKEFSYTVPDYFNGSLRVMAVAVDATSTAAATTSTTVRGDIVLLPNVPVALTPGDEVEIGVGVANNIKGSGKSASVALELQLSPALEVIGPAKQQLSINESGEATARYRVRAKAGAQARLGSASVVFVASHKGAKASLSTDLSVRPASALVTLVQSGRFKGSGEIATQGHFYAEMQRNELALSASPWPLAHGLLRYLERYPYGCTEQITSQVMPSVLLSSRPDVVKDLAGKAEASTVVDPAKAFAHTVNQLRTRQGADGGFGMYTGGDTAHPFGTVYATQMLLEAKERKLKVPDDMLARAMAWLQRYANGTGGDSYEWRNRAHAAYLLTRSGVVTTAALVNLRATAPKSKDRPNADIGFAYLAASYQLLKQDKVAAELFKPVWDDVVARSGKRLAFLGWDYYYDPMVHDAMAITLASRHFVSKLRDLPPEVFEQMGAWISDGWYNSLSSASVIMAVDAYSKAVAAGAAGTVGAKAVDRAGKVQDLQVGAITALARTAVPSTTAKLRLSNGSGLPIYYTLSESGYESDLPTTAASNGIEIIREFVDAAGKPLAEVTLGEDVTVRVRVRAIGREQVRQVALVDVLPGGLEPVLSPPSEEGSDQPLWRQRLGNGNWSWNVDYVDMREDRVIIFGNVNKSQTEITYKVRATNVGDFVVPGAFGEAMYERKLFGRSAASRIKVKERK